VAAMEWVSSQISSPPRRSPLRGPGRGEIEQFTATKVLSEHVGDSGVHPGRVAPAQRDHHRHLAHQRDMHEVWVVLRGPAPYPTGTARAQQSCAFKIAVPCPWHSKGLSRRL
jgi:hypothetical protein